MSMRDLFSSVTQMLALIPAAQAASFTGIATNTLGGRSLGYFVNTGAIVGAAVFALKLQESVDNVTFTDVIAGEVQSNAPAALAANSAYRLGYLGSKQFIRLAGTLASGTSLVIGATAVMETFKRPAP